MKILFLFFLLGSLLESSQGVISGRVSAYIKKLITCWKGMPAGYIARPYFANLRVFFI